MKLLIVESPAKAKTISKYLDGEYTVVSSVGHVRDLPKNNKKAIDISGGFAPHYEIAKGKEKVVAELKRLAKQADEVVLATDPDREGEAIAWHIKELCGLKDPKRIVFHEITKPAVKEALLHPRGVDENLRKAQEARRVLDRLVGYDLSGLIWKKVRYGLSAGRVQSPALRILMEREREIRAFKPEKYWIITAEVEHKSGGKFTVTCTDEPRDEKEVLRIIEAGKKFPWSVKDVEEKEVKRSPKAPFTTSTLQQSASSRLGFAPAKTMAVAQKLYENGFITYMRTDSTMISSLAQKEMLSFIEKKYGEKYVEPRAFKTKSKGAQEAHEAIRPTDIGKTSAGITDEQRKLYALIWQRAIASNMADATTLRTKIITHPEGGETPDFTITGTRILFEGWLAGDPGARGEETEVPKTKPKDDLELLTIDSEARETEPPPRYTEAGLVRELEKRGIGRPSTYASTIKTIGERGYVTKEGRTLFPTDTGDVVSSFLEKNFTTYVSDTFTAEMEDKLDQIANGERDYTKTLRDFYGPFREEVKSKETSEKITDLGNAPKEFKCPKCGKSMIIKLGRSGKFMSCRAFPKCDGARTIEGKELMGPRETGEMCPSCGKGKLVEREGKFGKFVGCANYPKCRYIRQDPGEQEKNKTDVKCPDCGKGFLTARRGRFRVFYSCSEYPACKFAIKAKPTGRTCPTCHALMMEGTKTIPERCSNKACPMHNPHKMEK